MHDGGVRLHRQRTAIRRIVEGPPLRLESGQGAIRIGRKIPRGAEAGQPTSYHMPEKHLSLGRKRHQFLLHFRRQIAVQDLRDDVKGEHLEVHDRIEQARGASAIMPQTIQMLRRASRNHGHVAARGAAQERGVHHRANASPIVSADQSDTLPQKLAHKVPRVVAGGFGVPVRVAEDGFDVFSPLEDA